MARGLPHNDWTVPFGLKRLTHTHDFGIIAEGTDLDAI